MGDLRSKALRGLADAVDAVAVRANGPEAPCLSALAGRAACTRTGRPSQRDPRSLARWRLGWCDSCSGAWHLSEGARLLHAARLAVEELELEDPSPAGEAVVSADALSNALKDTGWVRRTSEGSEQDIYYRTEASAKALAAFLGAGRVFKVGGRREWLVRVRVVS